jgi:Domain of unknown function (DUF1843)
MQTLPTDEDSEIPYTRSVTFKRRHMTDVRPYGVAIQQAVASGDLQQMKAAAASAEKYLSDHGDVSAALEALKIEIGKAEAKH